MCDIFPNSSPLAKDIPTIKYVKTINTICGCQFACLSIEICERANNNQDTHYLMHKEVVILDLIMCISLLFVLLIESLINIYDVMSFLPFLRKKRKRSVMVDVIKCLGQRLWTP